jgi:uncharacterized protein GlcG (DUF336 family)
MYKKYWPQPMLMLRKITGQYLLPWLMMVAIYWASYAVIIAHQCQPTSINGGRYSFLNATAVLQGTLEGGVNIVVDGQTIGAVGVSGVKSNEDAEIAKAGIAAL